MKLEAVEWNYDRAAKRYDTWNDLVAGRLLGLDRLRVRTIERLGDVRGKVVLDIGCGTGRNLPLLVPRVGAEGRVIAVDYSEGMLEKARARVARAGWDNVDLRRDDAAKLDAVDERVDAVVSVWCMGIVHDLEGALERAVDTLRGGGRLAIMDFDRTCPDHGPMRWLYPIYSRALRWVHIDTAEDLDDARMQARWRRGRAVLRAGLRNLHEERYLSGVGIILSGRRPDAQAAR